MAAQSPVPGCSRHPGMTFVYLCTNCSEQLICTKCVVDLHNGHKFVLIENVVSDKKVEIQQYMDQISDNDNAVLEENITRTEEKIKENGKRFRKMIANIKDQALKMKTEIEKCADKLIKLCCELETRNEEMLNSYKSALQNLKDRNTKRIEDCELTMKSGTNLEVINKAKEIRSEPYSPPFQSRKIKIVEFHPGPVSVSQLEHSFGSVTVDGQNQQHQAVMKPTVLSEFIHKSEIDTCRVTQKNAWLSFWKEGDMYKVDQEGNVNETIHCDSKVGRITISPTTGRLWFCCYEDNTVREVVDKNTILTHFVTDNMPVSLCITTNNRVVVGMLGKIVMYSTEGQEVESTAAKGLCRQEAGRPWFMAYSTETGNIVVSDCESLSYKDYLACKDPNKQPHIKVMNTHLNLRFRYPCLSKSDDGKSEDTQRTLFYPYDVCFDPNGNIIVAEAVSKSIILIDGIHGDYMRTLYVDNITMFSICLQTGCTLWVGLAQKKVKLLKYK